MARSPETISPDVEYAGEIPYGVLRFHQDGSFIAPVAKPVGYVGRQDEELILVVCYHDDPTPERVESCVRAERSRLHKRRIQVKGEARKSKRRLTNRRKSE